MEEVKLTLDDLQAQGRQFLEEVLAAANADRSPGARELTVEDVRRWMPRLCAHVSQPGSDRNLRNAVRRIRSALPVE
jgi:hypothetical protein